MVDEGVTIAVDHSQARGSRSKVDLVLTVGEVLNDCVASTPLNAEGVTTALPPDAVFAATSDQQIVATAAEEAVITGLPVDGVGSTVAFDDVVARACIDVFDGDKAVFPITGVLPAGGVELDPVGA